MFLQDEFLFLAKFQLDYPMHEFDHLTDYSWIEGLHTYYQICTSNSNLFIPIKGLSGKPRLVYTTKDKKKIIRLSTSQYLSGIIWYFTMVNQGLFIVVILMTTHVSNTNAFLGIGDIIHRPKVSMKLRLFKIVSYGYLT